MKLDTHELDDEIRQVRLDLDTARERVAVLESKLDWLIRGQELFGDSSSQNVSAGRSWLTKPTLTQAILTIIGEEAGGGWTAPKVMDQLRARGWMPNGSSAEHVVRARLAALARGDEAVLRRISHGVYELSELRQPAKA